MAVPVNQRENREKKQSKEIRITGRI